MVSDNPHAFAIQRANRAGIPVAVFPSKTFSSRRDHEKLILSILRGLEVDLVVLAGYMRILTPTFIKAYRGRILNIHPSLLPAFKGAHAIRDAFAAGVGETGASVHVVTVALDAGPVLAQARVKRSSRETQGSLEAKIHRVEHKLYPAAIGLYLKKLKRDYS